MNKRTWDAQQVADYLGVHKDSVYKMVRKEEIPHFRVLSRIFFLEEEIEAWIMNQSTMRVG
ncbi:helix-turn-helix domain-containing protein [Geomicrobium sp. JCM 19055]|uniref:helix-turn-helix domain-containing protein n=1 Tax=Geomicrobium sp. JCM 19055 TaxID=1460649 RepID=UPI0005AB280E|nr:helix-turn-helix domain-containing protein [Geomicrobium sp. JCM 19055]